jgi:hypothetical protein
MAEWNITNSDFVAKLFKTDKPAEDTKTEGTTGYTTVPMTADNDLSVDTPWAKMMGVNITAKAGEAFFSDADLAAFVGQYATDITPDVAAQVTDSMGVATDENLYVFGNVVPETSQDYYANNCVDGTADRAYSMGITADDVPDFTGGDATLLGTSALLFRDAQYLAGQV